MAGCKAVDLERIPGALLLESNRHIPLECRLTVKV